MISPWWSPISFLIGGLLGSGAVWSFLNYRQRKKEVELSSALSISKLQKDLADKLLELIARSEEYSDTRDGKIQVDIPDNKLMQLNAHIEILQSDIRSCEMRLAKLESREARSINVEYIRPEPPRGIKVIFK